MHKNQQFSPPFIVNKSQLREKLTPLEFQVTQEKHTERPFTNKYYKHNEVGKYMCKVCDEEIFESSTKYDSGSGWPSFFDVISQDKVYFRQDASAIGANLLLIVKKPELIRTEVCCRNCGSHLGHVFQDGPKPTGQRYCINSCSLEFRADSVEGVNLKVDLFHFPATLGGCDGSTGLCARKIGRKSPNKKDETP